MLSGLLKLGSIPTVGFAHHFYTEKEYKISYGIEASIEIVYIKNGYLDGIFDGIEFRVNEGCFLIIPRNLPIKLYTDGKTPHSHCSIELLMDYEFDFLSDKSHFDSVSSSLVIPFVTNACQETEELKKMLFSAISDIGVSREKYELSTSLTALYILNRLSLIYQKKLRENQDNHSILVYRIKKYISTALNSTQTLDEIAKKFNKTPNYINHIFKQQSGLTIRQYINKEKVHLLCEMIQYKKIPFKSACENIGITDLYYGYRLFKKHTGLTPKEYLNSVQTNLS